MVFREIGFEDLRGVELVQNRVRQRGMLLALLLFRPVLRECYFAHLDRKRRDTTSAIYAYKYIYIYLLFLSPCKVPDLSVFSLTGNEVHFSNNFLATNELAGRLFAVGHSQFHRRWLLLRTYRLNTVNLWIIVTQCCWGGQSPQRPGFHP